MVRISVHSFGLFIILLGLFTVTESRYVDDVVISIDGEKIDEHGLEKQKAEGKVDVSGNRTSVETDLSHLETEIGDVAVYAGGKIVQTYDGSEVDEEVVVSGNDAEQEIIIKANRNITHIEIDINRKGKESVNVQFDVDHQGEENRSSTDDESGEESSKHRVDTQYLDVYVEEKQPDGVVITRKDDEVNIDLDIELDEINLDDGDIVRIEIDLFGAKNGSTVNNSNIYIDAEYRNEARDTLQGGGQLNPVVTDLQLDNLLFPTTEPVFLYDPTVPCPEGGISFTVEKKVIIKRGELSVLVCETEGDFSLQYTWLKLNSNSGKFLKVGVNKRLEIASPSCSDAGMYVCQVAMFCSGEAKNYESEKIAVVVDNGVIINPMCQIYGDPHVVTYDNKFYSFQGQCTYLLSMDAERGDWIVYGRFVACGTGTCMESIVIYSQGFMIELQRGWVINLNGEKVAIQEGVAYEPHRSITVYFDGYEISVELRRPQIYLMWDGIMNFKLEIASNKRTLGLCGNNNGNQEDDFMTYYGNVLNDSNEFGHRAAVDRYGVCVKPKNVQLDTGNSNTKEARDACINVLQSDLFTFVGDHITKAAREQNKDLSTITAGSQLLDSCVFDYLSGMEILEKKLSPECYAGYHYVSMARRFGLCLPEGWQELVGCITKEELQDLTITTGCPYGDQPFPFSRTSANSS